MAISLSMPRILDKKVANAVTAPERKSLDFGLVFTSRSFNFFAHHIKFKGRRIKKVKAQNGRKLAKIFICKNYDECKNDFQKINFG